MQAFVIKEENGRLTTGVREWPVAPRDEHDVLVNVEYSGINYKDAMVASAPSRVRRANELVGGVDAAGVVEASSSDDLHVGDRVAVYGGDLGVGRDGGFATHVYSPARYLSVLPDSISTRDAMIIGTAGVTAMASVLALEERGLASNATVLVTGASGGVGSQSVTYLAARGYQPVASTGSPEHAQWLIERGAVRVIGRSDVSDRPERVLGSELWDGAIDCVGGETLCPDPAVSALRDGSRRERSRRQPRARDHRLSLHHAQRGTARHRRRQRQRRDSLACLDGAGRDR